MKTMTELTKNSLVSEALLLYPDYAGLKVTGTYRRSFQMVSRLNLLDKVTIGQLSRRFAADFRDALYKDGKATSTVKTYVSAMNNLTRTLAEYELCPPSLFHGLRQFKVPTKYPAKVVTQEQLPDIADALRYKSARGRKAKYDYYPHFLMSYYSSARLSELILSKAEDYDLVNGILHIAKAKNGKPRIAYLSPAAVELAHTLLDGKRGDFRPFPHTMQGVSDAMRRASKRLGYRLTFHHARHSAVTNAAEHISNIGDLMSFSGHCSLTAVARYTHPDVAKQQKRVSSLLATM